MEDEENLTPEEELAKRHRKEKKELQAEILKLRHASKNDKKKKKEATLQIAQLETALQQKHERELEELNKTQTELTQVVDGINNLTTEDPNETSQDGTKVKKVSKAQKRRDKKAKQEREREEAIRAAEIENFLGPRHQESQALKQILNGRELAIFEIPSDGNCLYAAINHQLKRHEVEHSVNDLRRMAAEHMRSHQDNFLPFLSKPDTGDPYSAEEFEEYCKTLESTPEWGGHLEIQALSNVLRCPIEVVQASGPSIMSGEEHHTSPLILSYHRYAYGLGEHYNSVIPLSEIEESEEEELS